MSLVFDSSKQLLFLTNRVGRQLSLLARDEMEFEGWKPQSTHMAIMGDLLQQDGIAQQDLAISTIKDKGTITRGLQGMEKEGILERRVNPNDRRNKLIFLTEKGRRMHSILRPHISETVGRATANIEPIDLAICIAVLQRMYHNLQVEINPTTKNNEPGNKTLA